MHRSSNCIFFIPLWNEKDIERHMKIIGHMNQYPYYLSPTCLYMNLSFIQILRLKITSYAISNFWIVCEYNEHLSRVYLPISSNFTILYFFTSKNGSFQKWLFGVDFCQKRSQIYPRAIHCPFNIFNVLSLSHS